MLLSFDHLGSNSNVVEVGGYRGGWGLEIAKRYSCNVVIFEPIRQFAGDIRALADGEEKIEINEVALGDTDSTASFFLSGDGSGAFRSGQPVTVTVRRPNERNFPIFAESIAVMLVNIEGGEYSLLDELIENGVIQRIQVLLVQFHRTPPGYRRKRRRIARRLSETHSLSFSFSFVWEKWELAEDQVSVHS